MLLFRKLGLWECVIHDKYSWISGSSPFLGIRELTISHPSKVKHNHMPSSGHWNVYTVSGNNNNPWHMYYYMPNTCKCKCKCQTFVSKLQVFSLYSFQHKKKHTGNSWVRPTILPENCIYHYFGLGFNNNCDNENRVQICGAYNLC